MSDPENPGSTDRRDFLKLVGAAGLASTLVPALALAQSAGSAGGAGKVIPKPKPTPQPVAPATPDEPAPISDDAKALASIIERRYGKYLDAAQLEQITKDLDQRIQGSKALRAVKLANSDEPDVTFRA